MKYHSSSSTQYATVAIAILVFALLGVCVHGQTPVTLYVNEGTQYGLTTELLSYSGIVETRNQGCNDGTCIRMENNGVASRGEISRQVDTTGYTNVTITTVVKTTQLNTGDACALWWMVPRDLGFYDQEIWRHEHAPGKQLGWTTLTFTNANIDNVNIDLNNSTGGFRYSTGQWGTVNDYCWLDRIEITGTPIVA